MLTMRSQWIAAKPSIPMAMAPGTTRDTDDDADGVADDLDDFPLNSAEQTDTDGDGQRQ